MCEVQGDCQDSAGGCQWLLWLQGSGLFYLMLEILRLIIHQVVSATVLAQH